MAQAALIDRGSGHDADGRMNWGDAMAWADGLNYGGYDNWRLPTTAQPERSPGTGVRPNWSIA
jgi:hypothetical protein